VQKSSGTLYWYGLNNEPLLETTLTGSPSFAYYYFSGRITHRRPWYHFWNTDTYVSDALGNTGLVGGLTPAGTGAWDYSDYYPYGGEWAHQSGIGNHYKFTGKERDPESGDDNFLARYYTSNLGRFTSPDDSDPSGTINPQGLNLYTYVQNNPSNATDPDGHDCVFRLGGNQIYYQKGDCSAAPRNADQVTYVPGDIDPKSAVYHEDTGTLNVNYTPYGDQGGAIANIFVGTPSHTAPTEFEKFASRIGGGADNVNAFVTNVGIDVAFQAAGRGVAAGTRAILAARAARAAAAGAVDLGNISSKIARQMVTRGWTKKAILNTIREAQEGGKVFNVVNKATGGPATEFVSPSTGRFVVVDGATKQVLQVSGPGFLPNHLAP
jgi:RHS repeat-associated protein